MAQTHFFLVCSGLQSFLKSKQNPAFYFLGLIEGRLLVCWGGWRPSTTLPSPWVGLLVYCVFTLGFITNFCKWNSIKLFSNFSNLLCTFLFRGRCSWFLTKITDGGVDENNGLGTGWSILGNLQNDLWVHFKERNELPFLAIGLPCTKSEPVIFLSRSVLGQN